LSTPIYLVIGLTKECLKNYSGASKIDRFKRAGSSGVTPDLVEGLKKDIVGHGFHVVGSEAVELGAMGFHAQRRQYHTKALLGIARTVAKGLSDWHVKVLLITDADIYDTGSLFVAGQAEVNGRAAVISVARLAAGDGPRFLGRVLKEALHELGHCLGLGHCNDHDCVMFASKVLADSDVKDHEFCQRCRTKAGRALIITR
jgi:archaemetzincin